MQQQNILTHYCNNISKSCKNRDEKGNKNVYMYVLTYREVLFPLVFCNMRTNNLANNNNPILGHIYSCTFMTCVELPKTS